MSGVAGRSGTNKHKDKPWADALRLAVMEEVAPGFKKLRKIAESCVLSAMNGDMTAIKEIGDRLDGKPAQAITGGDDDDAPVSVLHRLERLIVDPKSTANPDGQGVSAPADPSPV